MSLDFKTFKICMSRSKGVQTVLIEDPLSIVNDVYDNHKGGFIIFYGEKACEVKQKTGCLRHEFLVNSCYDFSVLLLLR